MGKDKIFSDVPVEVLATNDVPEEEEIVSGVDIDAPEVIVMLRVKVTTEFLDKTADLTHRRKGDIYEVDANRADELAALGFVKII